MMLFRTERNALRLLGLLLIGLIVTTMIGQSFDLRSALLIAIFATILAVL